jgi:DNA-binding NtrC family response regulator
MSSVLIVDDEESICWALGRLLTEDGHDVRVASSAEEAIDAVGRQTPDLVMLDVRLPGMDGLSAMRRLNELAGAVPIVVMTAFGSLQTAVQALGNGAFDYLTKPFDLDQAAAVISRALAQRQESRQPEAERCDLASVSFAASEALAQEAHLASHPDELMGKSLAMQQVFKRIALVASTEASVLITGESGTGKELVARAIHRHSLRAQQPLVPVNLAALSPTLVESELFGHVRGAFTGAAQSRAGLLELADGGTIFFDEVGDIPASVQVKLLRVLEQQEVTPVGDTRPRRSSFRIVTATNRDLRHEVRQGNFREDLYFRLAVFEITLPPLRDRVEDIPILAERFLRRVLPASQKAGRFTEATLAELRRRDWPGNVRELRNAVEHGALMAHGNAIAPEHLPPAIPRTLPASPDPAETLARAATQWAESQLGGPHGQSELYQQFLTAAEPALFDAVLKATGGNQAAAAQILGIHRATLRKKRG